MLNSIINYDDTMAYELNYSYIIKILSLISKPFMVILVILNIILIINLANKKTRTDTHTAKLVVLVAIILLSGICFLIAMNTINSIGYSLEYEWNILDNFIIPIVLCVLPIIFNIGILIYLILKLKKEGKQNVKNRKQTYYSTSRC